ncbi:hypothetical protein EIP86_010547 [Pleurotus ostreatoroseus]|nr:hypothetical protein EIP86_010547 [Pleurotus ostreatoroseus]
MPRVVKTGQLVLPDNPFSPVKDKSKRKTLFSDALPIDSSSQANPFATPRKPKHRPHVAPRDPSPDPFPLILPPKTPSSHKPSSLLRNITSTPAHHNDPRPIPKNTPITRARKRLRGEPVSPSPVKEKRARVFSQTLSTFARHSTLAFHSDDSGEDDAVRTAEEAPPDVEETFFNSPVKRPPDGKQFRSLFEEAPVTQQDDPAHPPRQPLSRTKTATLAAGPFGGEPKKKARVRAFSPEMDDVVTPDEPIGGSGKIKALDLSLNGKPEKRKSLKNGFPRAVLPGKDDLWDVAPGTQSTSASSNGSQAGPSKQGATATRKRPLSEGPMDISGELILEPEPSLPHLLPPSPPPLEAKSASRYGNKGKGKGKGLPAGSRKKAKMLEELASGEEDEDSTEDDDQVKELPWSWNARTAHITEGSIPIEPTAGTDSEPEFDPTLYRPAPISAPDSPVSGEFEVDLPEDLKRVLALSPHRTQKDALEEERIARELLYGRRETHYDPNRGGEIWDVGEISDEEGEENTKKALSDEEDWEGEPVPWEVGEL